MMRERRAAMQATTRLPARQSEAMSTMGMIAPRPSRTPAVVHAATNRMAAEGDP